MTPLSVWDPVKRCRVLNPKAFEPEEEMTAQPKTTLNPDAPWPGKVVEQPKVVVPKPRPPNSTSKIQNTTKNFEQWAKKLGIKHGIK